MRLARNKFTEFKERTGGIPDAELDAFWAILAPATIDGMIGEWQAGDVQPLVCVDADGNKFSNVALGKGEAGLRLERR